jgi:hypothetical protein
VSGLSRFVPRWARWRRLLLRRRRHRAAARAAASVCSSRDSGSRRSHACPWTPHDPQPAAHPATSPPSASSGEGGRVSRGCPQHVNDGRVDG